MSKELDYLHFAVGMELTVDQFLLIGIFRIVEDIIYLEEAF